MCKKIFHFSKIQSKQSLNKRRLPFNVYRLLCRKHFGLPFMVFSMKKSQAADPQKKSLCVLLQVFKKAWNSVSNLLRSFISYQ